MYPTEVIIHHTAGQDGPEPNIGGIRKWHMGTPPNGPKDGPYRDIAYHVVIEKVNDVYEAFIGRPWTWNGAHCPGHNQSAIGIALVGDFSKVPPSDAELAKATQITQMVLDIFKIPKTGVHRHSEFNDTDCPGDAFPWDKFKESLH